MKRLLGFDYLHANLSTKIDFGYTKKALNKWRVKYYCNLYLKWRLINQVTTNFEVRLVQRLKLEVAAIFQFLKDA